MTLVTVATRWRADQEKVYRLGYNVEEEDKIVEKCATISLGPDSRVADCWEKIMSGDLERQPPENDDLLPEEALNGLQASRTEVLNKSRYLNSRVQMTW